MGRNVSFQTLACGGNRVESSTAAESNSELENFSLSSPKDELAVSRTRLGERMSSEFTIGYWAPAPEYFRSSALSLKLLKGQLRNRPHT